MDTDEHSKDRRTRDDRFLAKTQRVHWDEGRKNTRTKIKAYMPSRCTAIILFNGNSTRKMHFSFDSPLNKISVLNKTLGIYVQENDMSIKQHLTWLYYLR